MKNNKKNNEKNKNDMKKYIRIAVLVLIALIFVGTFVFLYRKSQPKEKVYHIETSTVTDLKQSTVATGKIEPRDEIQIKPQISHILPIPL